MDRSESNPERKSVMSNSKNSTQAEIIVGAFSSLATASMSISQLLATRDADNTDYYIS